MKRLKVLSLIVLLVCVTVLSACTKAGNASIENCNNLYMSFAKKYTLDQTTNKIKIFDEDGYVDLSTTNSYETQKMNDIINRASEDGPRYVFSILKRGGEYDVLVQAVSKLYLMNNKTNYVHQNKQVPQKLKTKLYENIDDLKRIFENVAVSKKAMETTISNFNDFDALPVKESLKAFLVKYQKLIEKFYDVTSAYEQIVNEYIFPATTKTMIPRGGMERLILSSEIYLAKYYYLKHLVLVGNDNRFGTKTIYDVETGEYVNNPNYDSNFEVFKTIANAIVPEAAADNTDKIFYYGSCLEKFDSLKINLNNYEKAVNYIVSLKGNTINNPVAKQYLQFMESFDNEVTDYQNYLTVNIL